MFYFQSMFQQVYNGITGSAVLPAVQQILAGGKRLLRRGGSGAGAACVRQVTAIAVTLWACDWYAVQEAQTQCAAWAGAAEKESGELIASVAKLFADIVRPRRITIHCSDEFQLTRGGVDQRTT